MKGIAFHNQPRFNALTYCPSYTIVIDALPKPCTVLTREPVPVAVAENTISKRSPGDTGTGATFIVPFAIVPGVTVVRDGVKLTSAVVGLKVLLPAGAL